MYGKINSDKRKQMLAQISWDAKFDLNELELLLQGEIKNVDYITRVRLFQRIAESFSWYAILEMLTLAELKFLLQKEIISGLRSVALRKQYFYVQQRLQQHI